MISISLCPACHHDAFHSHDTPSRSTSPSPAEQRLLAPLADSQCTTWPPTPSRTRCASTVPWTCATHANAEIPSRPSKGTPQLSVEGGGVEARIFKEDGEEGHCGRVSEGLVSCERASGPRGGDERKPSQKMSDEVECWICRKGKTRQMPCGSVFHTCITKGCQ